MIMNDVMLPSLTRKDYAYDDDSEIGGIHNFSALNENGEKIDIFTAAYEKRAGIEHSYTCCGCGNSLRVDCINSDQKRPYYSHNKGESCLTREIKPRKDPLGREFHKREIQLTEEQVEHYKARISNLEYMFQKICDIKMADAEINKIDSKLINAKNAAIRGMEDLKSDFLQDLSYLDYDDQVFVYDQCRATTCIAKTEFCDQIKDAINQNALDIIKSCIVENEVLKGKCNLENYMVSTPDKTSLSKYFDVKLKTKYKSSFSKLSEDDMKIKNKLNRMSDDGLVNHCVAITSPMGLVALVGDVVKGGTPNIRITPDDLNHICNEQLTSAVNPLIDMDNFEAFMLEQQEVYEYNLNCVQNTIDELMPDYKDAIGDYLIKYAEMHDDKNTKYSLNLKYNDIVKYNDLYTACDFNVKIDKNNPDFKDLCKIVIEDKITALKKDVDDNYDDAMKYIKERDAMRNRKSRYETFRNYNGCHGMFNFDLEHTHRTYKFYSEYDGKYYGNTAYILINYQPYDFIFGNDSICDAACRFDGFDSIKPKSYIVYTDDLLNSNVDVNEFFTECCNFILKDNNVDVKANCMEDIDKMWDYQHDININFSDKFQIPSDKISKSEKDDTKQIVRLRTSEYSYMIFDDHNQFDKSGKKVDSEIYCHALRYDRNDADAEPKRVTLDCEDIYNICYENGYVADQTKLLQKLNDDYVKSISKTVDTKKKIIRPDKMKVNVKSVSEMGRRILSVKDIDNGINVKKDIGE